MYNTPWGPASGLIKEVSRLHPNVTIDVEYEEPGMNFLGIEQYLNGELVHEQHHEYNFDDGFIKLEDGYKVDFDTDWDDENQDPAGTVNDAVYAALEHMWNHYGLRNAPVNETVIQQKYQPIPTNKERHHDNINHHGTSRVLADSRGVPQCRH